MAADLQQKRSEADSGSGLLFDNLYPNDSDKVQEFLRQCQQRKCAGNAEERRKSLVTGEGWKACFRRVEAIREHLKKEFGWEAGPQMKKYKFLDTADSRQYTHTHTMTMSHVAKNFGPDQTRLRTAVLQFLSGSTSR